MEERLARDTTYIGGDNEVESDGSEPMSNSSKTCPQCNGVGKNGHRRQYQPTEWLLCEVCNGTGTQPTKTTQVIQAYLDGKYDIESVIEKPEATKEAKPADKEPDWLLLQLCNCDGFWHTYSNGKPHRGSIYLDTLIDKYRPREATALSDHTRYCMEQVGEKCECVSDPILDEMDKADPDWAKRTNQVDPRIEELINSRVWAAREKQVDFDLKICDSRAKRELVAELEGLLDSDKTYYQSIRQRIREIKEGK